MSDSTKQPPTEATCPARPLAPVPPGAGEGSEPGAKLHPQQGDHAASAIPEGWGQGDDPREALKQRLEETRLPADIKAQILARLPPPEEQERLYRELQENGGLSFEEFLDSLDLPVKP